VPFTRDIRRSVAVSLTDDQQALIEEVRRIARDDLVPLAGSGRPGRVNRPLIKALAQNELLRRLFPKRAGGIREGDASAVELCLLREALARESTEAETALAMQGLGAYPILQGGADSVVQRWIPAVVDGCYIPGPDV
jgi:acyl-CoA dehydrogenase